MLRRLLAALALTLGLAATGAAIAAPASAAPVAGHAHSATTDFWW